MSHRRRNLYPSRTECLDNKAAQFDAECQCYYITVTPDAAACLPLCVRLSILASSIRLPWCLMSHSQGIFCIPFQQTLCWPFSQLEWCPAPPPVLKRRLMDREWKQLQGSAPRGLWVIFRRWGRGGESDWLSLSLIRWSHQLYVGSALFVEWWRPQKHTYESERWESEMIWWC